MKNLIEELGKYTGELEEAARVDTGQYEFSHGKKPRGRGFWIFGLDDKDPDISRSNEDKTYFSAPPMTYKEALKAAQKFAKEKGVKVLYVLP